MTATCPGTLIAVQPGHPAYDRWSEIRVQAFRESPSAPPRTRRPGSSSRTSPRSAAETATARQIVARLDAMPPTDARYLACFAYVMSRASTRPT